MAVLHASAHENSVDPMSEARKGQSQSGVHQTPQQSVARLQNKMEFVSMIPTQCLAGVCSRMLIPVKDSDNLNLHIPRVPRGTFWRNLPKTRNPGGLKLARANLEHYGPQYMVRLRSPFDPCIALED